MESIAGQETKIPHVRWYDQKVEKKQKAKQNKKKCVAWRIPGTGACWAAVHGVTESRT